MSGQGVAIVGCGLVGRKRAAALDGARLVACADTVSNRAVELARSVRGTSAPVTVRIVPKLVTTFVGTAVRGSAYYFTARLVPASSGRVAPESSAQ